MRAVATADGRGSANFPSGSAQFCWRPNKGSATASSSSATRPLLARSGAKVVLEVQPELKALLAGVDGVASCHARGETLPAYDVYCPLGSLPLAFKTEPATIPADIPYLRADEGAPREMASDH